MMKSSLQLLALAFITPLVTFTGVYLAYCERGYLAIGGEALLPMFCVGIYAALTGK